MQLRKGYNQLRVGARVHGRGIAAFEKTPQASLVELFKQASQGAKLTSNQTNYLLKTLSNLKRNYELKLQMERDLSARDMLQMITNGLGVRPEANAVLNNASIQKILEATKGQGGIVLVSSQHFQNNPTLRNCPFGIELVVPATTFRQIVDAAVQQKLTLKGEGGKTAGFTTTIRINHGTEKVPLTIIPESADQSTSQHEKAHREAMAAGMKRSFTGPPKNRAETREFIFSRLQGELVTHIKEGDMRNLAFQMEVFFKEEEQRVRETLTKEEIHNFLGTLSLIGKEAINRIPREELVEIVRTTPLLKLRRRLEGVLAHTETKK